MRQCRSSHSGAVCLAQASPPVTVFTSELCLGHDPGWFIAERPERLAILLTALRGEWAAEWSSDQLRVKEPEADVTEEQLLRVHTKSHLELLDAAFRKAAGFMTPRVNLDADTVVSQGSRAAAWRAAGLVVAAVDEVLGPSVRKPRHAFVMARPPGHHAEPDRPMGFCLLNNVMVGAAHAQAVHGVGRVAVLDFDVHHGNGCAAMCWSDPSRLYASSHQRDIFPAGSSKFTPAAAGGAGTHGQVLNSPLPAGAGPKEFRDTWARQILPLVRDFAPEAIFLNTGFDAHAEEDIASINLEDDDYAWITAEVVRLGVPIVSVLEGGYNIDVLKRCSRAHLKALIETET